MFWFRSHDSIAPMVPEWNVFNERLNIPLSSKMHPYGP